MFADIYKVVSNWNPEKEPKKFFYESKAVDFFVPQLKWQKGGVRKKSNNNIYAYHGNTHPQVLRAPQINQIFTGQGVEKNNMAHGIILRKSNKWILLGMSSDKKDVNGSLKNMKGRYEITQREKKATGMLKLKKPESEQKLI